MRCKARSDIPYHTCCHRHTRNEGCERKQCPKCAHKRATTYVIQFVRFRVASMLGDRWKDDKAATCMSQSDVRHDNSAKNRTLRRHATVAASVHALSMIMKLPRTAIGCRPSCHNQKLSQFCAYFRDEPLRHVPAQNSAQESQKSAARYLACAGHPLVARSPPLTASSSYLVSRNPYRGMSCCNLKTHRVPPSPRCAYACTPTPPALARTGAREIPGRAASTGPCVGACTVLLLGWFARARLSSRQTVHSICPIGIDV
jgi:hypothetical protein